MDYRRPAEIVWDVAQIIMYREAYRILSDKADAEDAVMDAMCRVIKNEEKFSALECNEICSLAVIYVRNTAIDIYNARHRNPYPIEEALPFTCHDEAPDEVVSAVEVEKHMLRLIEQLPEALRDVMLLKYHYGYKNSEISTVLGLENGTVRTRISRARRYLKEQMKGWM